MLRYRTYVVLFCQLSFGVVSSGGDFAVISVNRRIRLYQIKEWPLGPRKAGAPFSQRSPVNLTRLILTIESLANTPPAAQYAGQRDSPAPGKPARDHPYFEQPLAVVLIKNLPPALS